MTLASTRSRTSWCLRSERTVPVSPLYHQAWPPRCAGGASGGHRVQTAVNYPSALPFLAVYSRLNCPPEQFTNAFAQQGTILSLPMFAGITSNHQHTVIELIRAF